MTSSTPLAAVRAVCTTKCRLMNYGVPCRRVTKVTVVPGTRFSSIVRAFLVAEPIVTKLRQVELLQGQGKSFYGLQ